MFGVAIGGNSGLKVSDEAKAAVAGAAGANTRAVKITIEAKSGLNLGKVIAAGDSFEKDFEEILASVEDELPCFFLVRLAGHDENTDADFALVAWNPGGVPVKLRMLQASSQESVKNAFPDLKFKVYTASEKDEIAWSQVAESTKSMSKEERREVMSRSEIEAAEIRELQLKEQMAAPKKMAGMVALKISAEDSFKDAVKELMQSSKGDDIAVMGKLTAGKCEGLSGEIIEDVGSISSLKGKLPEDIPVYILMKAHGDSLLLISWLPDNGPAKIRMKLSTFKASVLDLVKELTGEDEILTGESSCEDWLDEDLGKPVVRGDAEAAPPKKEDGYKPCAGAVKMPGMPVGGFKMPGM